MRVRDARGFDQAQLAGEWITSTFGRWRASLSAAEVIALDSYKGEEYREINGALRGQREISGGAELLIESLDRAIERMRLPEPVIAYRAIALPALAAFPGDLTGRLIEEQGYVSTSLLRDVAEEDFLAEPLGQAVMERVYVPGGASVAVRAAAPDLVRDLGEYELLLPHGTLLRVTADHGSQNTYRSIDVEVVQ